MRQYYESNVPWIGMIPSTWRLSEIAHFTRSMSGGTPSRNKPEFWDDGDIPWMSSGEVNKGEVWDTNERITQLGFVNSSAKLLKKNTVVIALNGQGKTKGMSAILKIEATCNQSLCGFMCDEKNLTYKYLYYCFQAMYKYLRSQAGDDSREGLAAFFVKKQKIPVPSIDEQKAIADYLDAECRKIDDLIAKEEKRVSLLQEVRLSILTKVVLQGLNGEVETAPSKHSWLGSIPKHWKIMPLRYTANAKGCCFIDGDWIESKDIDYDGSIKYLTTGNVGPGFYKEQGLGYITEEKFKELDCIDVLPGDLLISRLNEPIARTCIVPDLGSRLVTAVDNVIFRPNPNVLDRRFACYYMNNGRLTEHANIIARGATMHRISRTMLGHLPIVLPPLNEQQAIVTFLDKECGQYDNRIVKANHQIDLLKEYKQSLITEVVTGKRKVC